MICVNVVSSGEQSFCLSGMILKYIRVCWWLICSRCQVVSFFGEFKRLISLQFVAVDTM